ASISTITREEMEQKAYTDITDAIKDLPGVVLTGGGTSQDISIRGMAPSYTMILVDGKRINSRETRPNSDGPGIEQGWLPPLAAIDRVEVIRGPMSSLYGSDAMGGIVNIITRKVPAQWTGKLRLEGTVQQDSDAGNSLQGGAYLAGPLIDDVLGLQVYGSRSGRREDDILNGFGQLDEKAGNIKLSWRLNEHNDITAESGYSHQRRQSTKGRSTARRDNDSHYYQRNYALTHEGHWNGITSNSHIQRIKSENPGRDMQLENTELKSMWTLPLGRHIVTLGAQLQKEDLHDAGNQLEDGITTIDRYQWALFAEDEWWLRDDLSLTGGLRMTHDENYGTH